MFKNARRFFSAGVFFLGAVVLSGCATVVGSLDPSAGANVIAQQNGFKSHEIETRDFVLRSYVKFLRPGMPMRVYIEGDGLAWESKTRLSVDPTPRNPLVLTLASLDETSNVAYLARPCQYALQIGGRDKCEPDYWSGARFSEQVIASMNEAVDRLKSDARASTIELVGYSGGGAVAVLVAARRLDVISLRTIAGNLDHEAVNGLHQATPMGRSLNAIDVAPALSKIPQIHFIGEQDTIVPSEIAEGYLEASAGSSCVRLVTVRKATHQAGWADQWAELARDTPVCS